VADVTSVTNENPAPEAPSEPASTAETAGPRAVDAPVASEAVPALSSQQRVWSMPKAPVTRKQADDLARIALKAATVVATFVAGVFRFVASIVRQVWRVIEAVPPALQLFSAAGVFMLLGVVGAIALPNSLGLTCIVVVIPVCSIVIGAVGHRWYSRLDNPQAQAGDSRTVEPATSDLQRSIEYVDKKLAVALTSFGTERHQQAVIALFQAKTAVELTLGTEQDTADFVDVPVPIGGDHSLRPRIRVGSASKSPLRESNSLAAS
jgi:hypothetical protein